MISRILKNLRLGFGIVDDEWQSSICPVGRIEEHQIPLGTIEIPASSNQVHVYPNPAKEYFVCTPENAEFINPKTEIYNVLGQNIAAETTFAGDKVAINTTQLSSGFYVVRIVDAGKAYLAKVMIQQ